MDPQCLQLSMIAAGVLILTCLSYGLLFAVQITSFSFARAPFFTAYLLAMFVYMPFWNPNSHPALMLSEPPILALRFGVAVEAFCLGTEWRSIRERRMLLSLLLGITAVGCTFGLLYYSADPRALRMFMSFRQQLHLGLAIASLGACVCYRLDRHLISHRIWNHVLIVAVYFCNYAVIGFLKNKTQPDWLEHVIYLQAMALVCVVFWWKFALLIPALKVTKRHTQPANTLVQA